MLNGTRLSFLLNCNKTGVFIWSIRWIGDLSIRYVTSDVSARRLRPVWKSNCELTDWAKAQSGISDVK